MSAPAPPVWQVCLEPETRLSWPAILRTALICVLGAIVGVEGLLGLVLGTGIVFGNHGRGVSIGGAENFVVAGFFAVVGLGAVPAVLYWFLWHRLVVETVTLDSAHLTISRRALGHGVTLSFPRNQI